MKSSALIVISLIASLHTSVEAQVSTIADCVATATMEGGLLAGRIFKIQALIPGTTQQDAMRRIAKTLVKEGLTIGTLDKDIGILSASFSKRAIGGRAPSVTTVSFSFEPKGNDLLGSGTMTIPAGITSSEELNKKELCTVMLE